MQRVSIRDCFRRYFLSLLIITMLVSFGGWALAGVPFQKGTHFDLLRHDQTLPKQCQQISLGNFAPELQTFTVSVNGALEQGFSQEFPIQRKEAFFLWKALQEEQPTWQQEQELSRSKVLRRYYEALTEARRVKGFDFTSEGEILEVLAQQQLEEIYGANRVFVTGSVAYHEPAGIRYIGELDLIVGDRANCQIFLVGEAKLGLKMLSKAQEQMARFVSFLGHHQATRQQAFPLGGFWLLEPWR